MWPHNVVLVVLVSCFILCNGNLSKMQEHTKKVNKLPNLHFCGMQKFAGKRIYGGDYAALGEFPWMAAIGSQRSRSRSIKWFCSGSIITDQWVLTAAHCVHPPTLRALRVSKPTHIRVGDLDLNPGKDDKANPKDFKIAKVVYHEHYDISTQTNDIAVIKTDNKIHFDNYVQPICLPTLDFVINEFIGESTTIAGWGKTDMIVKNELNPAIREPVTALLKAVIEVKDRDQSRRNITSNYRAKGWIIDDRVVAASGPKTDSCQGDSGGPLMMHRIVKRPSNGNWYVMGVVSYGLGCADERYPGVYTRVAKYIGWIIENMDI